jgi:hypothetical protein
MLRLIGLMVVVAVLYLGFGEIRSWYQGESTPQEMVDGVKQKVGETLVDSNGKNAGENSKSEAAASKPAPAPESTQDRLRNMLKDN